ncbi:MAG TPA: PQQ-dependent sugar dehydrogenase, partial [Pirellulaceae bacterium]|nr:PQQ-dependent sugar dehydrogenase [Pirellulaceae bacterium]
MPAEPVVLGEYECRTAAGPIEIDGKGDEEAWKSAQPIERFGLPWLKESARPSKTATKARLLWDRDYLYFQADLEDHDLFADVREHDGKCWDNDVFELFFRPAQDKPAYYEFQVNALGTKFDSIMPKGNKTFEEIVKDGVFEWKTAVVRRGTLDNRSDRDEGWSVEGRIPWSDLARTGGRPTAGDVWRFALCRYDYTLGQEPELSSCAPLTQRSFHQSEQYAKLKFVAAEGDKKIGIEKRVPLTTSKVVGSPDPPLPYRPVRAFPQLKLTYPIALDRVPGTDTLLIIAQGRSYGATTIYKIQDDPAVTTAEPLLETPAGGTAYGICFHPKFAENGYLYIGWNGSLNKAPKKTYATRYTFDREKRTIDAASELHIISWESDGHNGGDVEFGTDGMFYITSGDGTSDSDTNLRGQDLTKHTAKLLRIDVDHPADGRQYSVPPDNPFVGQKDFVPEAWAYGFRNPWRLAVDPTTGHIWVGNNGQDIWEQIFFVRKADNFGWSVYEGSHPFYLNRTMGPQPLALPAAEHHHNVARSLTGGVVYYGKRLPELVGAYIYGDHSTGRVWAMKHDGQKVEWHKLLCDTTFNITGFGLDSHGELLVADHRGNSDG